MTEPKRITPEEHREQIKAYTDEVSHYEEYATVLKRVLESGCAASFPEALVQARPKSISSFAEKCVRRYDKYPDAVNQMTDLCGIARGHQEIRPRYRGQIPGNTREGGARGASIVKQRS